MLINAKSGIKMKDNSPILVKLMSSYVISSLVRYSHKDFDKEISNHKINSPIDNNSLHDIHTQNSFDKDHVKELEFYKNLAKAASLSNHNEHSPQHESQHSAPNSPQPMQIDADAVDDELRDHHMTDEHDQANASALAVAAAAAQAHLNGTMQDMINLQKLQNLATLQQHQQQQQQHHSQQKQHLQQQNSTNNVDSATAAALASLQGLAAGITASAAAALNSPLNLSVGSGINSTLPNSLCSPTTAAAAAAAAATLSATNAFANNINSNNKVMSHASGSQDNTGTTSPNSHASHADRQTSAQSTLANVLNSAAAAAAAAGAAATASPPPTLQAPPASAQMPQLILASGQLVQGVQGAQLLIPTAQGIAVQTILTIPVSPQINTNEQFMQNFGAFASFQQQQQQQHLLAAAPQLPPPLSALQHAPTLPQLAQTPTNLLKPNLFSNGVQQLLAALHPELFAAAAVNHHHQQREQQQHLGHHTHLTHHAHTTDLHLGTRSSERTPPSSPTSSTKAAAAAAAAAAAFHLQQQLQIKQESVPHLSHHHALQHHALRHPDELASPKMDCKGTLQHSDGNVSPPPTSRHHYSSSNHHHHRNNAISSPSPRPSSSSSSSMNLRDRESHHSLKHSPSRNANSSIGGMNLSQHSSERERERDRDRERERERERAARTSSPVQLNSNQSLGSGRNSTSISVSSLATATSASVSASLSAASSQQHHSSQASPTTSTTTTIPLTNCSATATNHERGYSSPLGGSSGTGAGQLFRSHSPNTTHLHHHQQQQHLLGSPHERDFLGGSNGCGTSSHGISGTTNATSTAAANVLNSINRLTASNGELTITKSHGPPTATATRASSASPTLLGPAAPHGGLGSGVHLHHPHHPLHPLKLSPTTSSALQQRERERERERERDRERDRERERERDMEREPPQISPNGTESSTGPHDLLMDSPNEPTINQATTNVVDGIDLDDIKEFAKAFKLRRLSLGLTQTQVGQALSVTEGPAYSQSAICSALAAQMYAAQLSTQQQNMFEKLDITPKSAQKIKPVLERWMKEAEESHWNRYKSGQNHLTDYIGVEPSKKRKRRTSFTPQALELLNAHFERNTHPSGTEITGLAHQLGYEREVIRIWFCNKRQALKNTVRMMSKGMV
ncbi:ecdysone-induced protein 74EF [Teleopsis dalmanni]|uniref:ecdysone-induced protein 74EF n=1 Tax=Teleopsis dalmanni TaxID=139649 RepID=UPI0018CCA8F4|nr:ecdysone-induced protein 74EF [Teleopsis dalmanni]